MTIIVTISFLGELLHSLIPVPVPASIYGMVLLFLALHIKLIQLEQVKETGHFLVSIMAVMFVVPAVGLMDCWDILREDLFSIGLIIIASLVLSFAVTGIVTQLLIRWRDKNNA